MLSYVVAKGKYRKDCTESHQRSHSGTVARQLPFTDSHAAAIKHTVIAIENIIGRIKRYLQLTTVIAAKQTTNAHTAPRRASALKSLPKRDLAATLISPRKNRTRQPRIQPQ